MAHNIARLPLVTAILLLTGPAAIAQTDYSPLEQAPVFQPTTTQPVRWDRAEGFRVECGQDLQRFCNGVQPGEGRLIQCLSSHRSELSSVCTARVAATRPALGEAPTSENKQSPGPSSDSRPPGREVTESALRASCGPDAQKLCGGISRGNGGVIKCLSTHRMELSSTCDAFFNEMPMQRAAQKGTPKAKPPTAHSPAATPAMTNGTASTAPPLTANGSTATPSVANGAADSGAPPATNGPTSTPSAANGAADSGAPPATNGAPTTSAPPPANILPAKGALAIPL
jgi:hypothetical protein